MTGLVRNVFGGVSALASGGSRVRPPGLDLPDDAATQDAIDVADEDLANLNTLNRRAAEVSGRGGTILTGLTDTQTSTTGSIARPSGGNQAIEDDFIEEEEEESGPSSIFRNNIRSASASKTTSTPSNKLFAGAFSNG